MLKMPSNPSHPFILVDGSSLQADSVQVSWSEGWRPLDARSAFIE